MDHSHISATKDKLSTRNGQGQHSAFGTAGLTLHIIEIVHVTVFSSIPKNTMICVLQQVFPLIPEN